MEIFKLKETLKALDEQTRQLCLVLDDSEAICANSPGPFLNGDRAISLISERITNIWCGDDQRDGRETPVGIGAVACNAQAISIAQEINLIKDDLASQFKALRALFCGKGQSRAGHDKAFRRFLADAGLGRLSLRLVNRHIPILDQTPKKIDFSLSTKGKSISRMTAEQAIDLLLSSGMEGAHIDIQIKKLIQLPATYPLAQIQHLKNYYKSNIRSRDGIRTTRPVFLPIFYPKGKRVILPEELCGVQRSIRARKDINLETEPFIPSLRLYLYKNVMNQPD